jgi:small subunit ribosomal protein S29
VLFATKKPAQKQGKTRSSFSPTKQQTKVKKGGMTHLTFKDAVTEMGFEKLAGELTVETVSASNLSNMAGSVVKYSPETLSKLNMLKAFKPYQHHELFQSPITLVSKNTTKLYNDFIESLNDKSSGQNRWCLTGEKGCGKSTILSQSIALASSKYDDLIVLHLDRPENIVNGTSDYIFNPKLNKYQQPMFTKRWIWKLKNANEAIFKKLKLSKDIQFQTKRVDHSLKKGENTVYDLLQLNHDFGKFAPTTAFQFLVEELVHHSATVPVLVSLDNVNGIVNTPITKYNTSEFKPIHVSDFEMGDFILKLTSGELSFAKGGVLMSDTSDFAKHSKTLAVALGTEQYDPYCKKEFFDLGIANRLLSNGGITRFAVENLSKEESTNLLKFYKDNEILQVREYPTKETLKEGSTQTKENFDVEAQFEKLVNNHFTVSAGNPGYLLKTAVLNY